MKENLIKEKSFSFALRIVKLYQFLTSEKKEYVLSKQVLRSGTSIGANIREAEHGESKSDFTHKMSISLKEANETVYWLDLLVHGEYLSQEEYNSINEDAIEILKMLIAIVKSSKK
jgi:four helix bundle protein